LATKATKFGEITQSNGHYAAQGHSWSPILVPVESLYATSYLWLILTSSYLTLIPSYGRSLVKFSLGVLHFSEFPTRCCSPHDRTFILLDKIPECDGQTDKIALNITAVCITSDADAL